MSSDLAFSKTPGGLYLPDRPGVFAASIAGAGGGAGFMWRSASAWLPEALPGLLLLVRSSRSDLVTYSTQPTVNDPEFTGVAPTWSRTADWSITGGQAVCASAANTSNQVYQYPWINGNRYTFGMEVVSVAGGTLSAKLGANIACSATSPGTYTGEATASSISLAIFLDTIGASAAVERVFGIQNLSINSVVPCAGTYTYALVHTTGTVMPWYKEGRIYADMDTLQAKTNPSTFTPFHRNADYYWFAVATASSLGANRGLWSTLASGASEIGARAYVTSAGKVAVRVQNGSVAAYDSATTTPVVVTAGNKFLLIGKHVSGPSPTYSLFATSTTPIQTFNGNAASFDTTVDAGGLDMLAYIRNSSSYAWVGSCELFGVGVGALDTLDIQRLGQYCNTVFGTPWS